MRLIAHAKINWTLAVTGRRPDGYHDLDMLMQSVWLGDTLELHPADSFTLSLMGGPRVPSGGDNLVLKAAEVIRDAAQVRRGARITLKKRIPVGAGLGGGSADAAAILLGLNELWDLRFSGEELSSLALAIGADVPFCMLGGLARAQGVGEILTEYPSPAPFELVIVQPCEGLSTPSVFKAYDALPEKAWGPRTDDALRALCAGDAPGVAASMGNALMRAAIPMRPDIAVCAQALEHFGALRAQMTGSGSAVVGLFDTPDHAAHAARACSRIWRRCFQTRTVNCGVSIISDIK